MSFDLADIQGLIHHHYGYPKTRHLLFEIGSPATGMHMLKFLAPRTNTAVPLNPKPESLLNVGITYGGLEALGVKPQLLKRFPQEFRDEPDPVTMGDFDASDPVNWWNGKFKTQQVHLVVHLYGQSPEALDKVTAEVRAAAGGNRELLPLKSESPIEGGWLSDIPGELHFGYHDGISQPTIRWDDGPLQQGEVDYRHFILGYATNEIPSAPQEFASDPSSSLAAELGRNGTYSVFRWLYQDVALFNRFLDSEGPKTFPELSPEDAQELLAAKLMGRWRDGTPLAMSPNAPDQALSSRNDFDYATDRDGRRCPFSAHIRVTNPRDQELDHASIVLGGVPRVIRRGAPYGSKLMGTVDDQVDRGLVGMFLCASIVRQFYKQVVWMKENNFSPVFPNQHSQDPLANRLTPDASNQFLIPAATGDRTVTLQDFVTTKGTAFFLLPGVQTLHRLADGQFQ
ncbi:MULTISPECIES: Dyp-type peroxidase [Pseudomonas]|uniref:Dyp-type peroxidase n=1 Tax=Pseudomonas TaxID=286 RepID=UPI0039069B9F